MLRSALELVYAAPFSSPTDHQYVREAVAAQLKATGSPASESLETGAIDASGLGVLRIGSIYLKRGEPLNLPLLLFPCALRHMTASAPWHAGDEEGAGTALVHTPLTVARLRTLAAAASSGRTVCLEGGTACGKTALVQELARLAGRRLHVLPLTADSGVHSALHAYGRPAMQSLPG